MLSNLEIFNPCNLTAPLNSHLFCAGNGTVEGLDMLDLQACTAGDGDPTVQPVVFPHKSYGLTIAGLLG